MIYTSLQAPPAVLGTQSFHSVDAKQYLLAFYSQTQNLVSSNYLLQYYTMTMNVSIFAKKWIASLFFWVGVFLFTLHLTNLIFICVHHFLFYCHLQ